MLDYRAYILDRDGHIVRSVEFHCENEDAAKERARQLVDGHDVELWQRERKVSTFLHAQE